MFGSGARGDERADAGRSKPDPRTDDGRAVTDPRTLADGQSARGAGRSKNPALPSGLPSLSSPG